MSDDDEFFDVTVAGSAYEVQRSIRGHYRHRRINLPTIDDRDGRGVALNMDWTAGRPPVHAVSD